MHTRQKRCEFCGRFFIPDRRVGNRQKSCCRLECRKKRKASAQAAWVSKNVGYFKGRYENTKRWRNEHPDYRRSRVIQDEIPSPTPMKSVRLLLPAVWFKEGIQDTKAVITIIDPATYACTATGTG